MLTWLRELDRILRGEATRPAALRKGVVEVLEQELAVGLLVLGAVYGACMGTYALSSREAPEFRQLLAAMLKVPALFVLTVLVTFPSLYVFNALVGCRLTLLPMLRLVLAALSVLLAVLSSLGPIVAFFSITTSSYPFILLLNVAAFTVAGVLGLGFLFQTLQRLSVIEPAASEEVAESVAQQPDASPRPAADVLLPADPLPVRVPPSDRAVSPPVKLIFCIWMAVFALVGGQMAWVLRPFVGDPREPFVVFRHRETSHIFQGLWNAVTNLFAEPEPERRPAPARVEPENDKLLEPGRGGAPLPGDARP